MKLNRNQIKYIAIIAMLIDHIAWAFVPTASVPGQLLHFIGRLTGPTMAFMIAEGYQHTRDVRKYALRMGLFALISQIPYSLFESGKILDFSASVIYTLFLGLLAIIVWDSKKASDGAKITAIILLCILSFIGDWPVTDVLLCLFFFINRNDEKKKWTTFAIIAACEVAYMFMVFISMGQPFRETFQLGIFMVIPFLKMYNGQPGSRKPFHKWFFYVFYPAHLLVLAYLKYWVFG